MLRVVERIVAEPAAASKHLAELEGPMGPSGVSYLNGDAFARTVSRLVRRLGGLFETNNVQVAG